MSQLHFLVWEFCLNSNKQVEELYLFSLGFHRLMSLSGFTKPKQGHCTLKYKLNYVLTLDDFPPDLNMRFNPVSPLKLNLSRSEILFAVWERGRYSWTEANNICRKYGGTLPSINRLVYSNKGVRERHFV